LNPTLTARACDMVTVQAGFVPAQAPPQPPNVLPPVGVAVSTTDVPCATEAEHWPLVFPALAVQESPPVFAVVTPVPVPVAVTVMVCVDGLNVAVTDCA
jgi:hypothetical protein